MKSINKLLVGLGLTAVCFMAASSSTYAAVAGHVQFVSGNVQISNAEGLSRPAQKGDAINEGDMLTSAQKSSAQIKMQDGGFIAVRPGSRMKFDQYSFSGQADGTERNFFSLFKGGFRAVTGLIGRVNKQNYRVTTPAATIGIRGTDYEVSVVEAASAKLAYADLPLLAESDITPPTTGPMSTTYAAVNRPGDAIEVSNQFGKVRVDNVGIMARVQFNQSPVIESRRQELFSSATLKSGVKVGKKEGKEEAKPETTAEDSAAAEATQDSGAQGDGESVRETAPVDAAPPATGGVPAANASTISDTTAVVATNNQNAPTNVVAADGTQFNTSAGTATTPGGQVITPTQGTVAPPVNADLYAYEVVAATGAAGAYSIVNPWGGAMPNTAFALSTANELVSAANASLKDSFSGGAALDVWKSADSSIYMGRWQGGSITTTDLAGATVGVPVVLGAGSAHWIVSAQTPLNYVQTLAGTNKYTLVAATAPTDAMGNVGVLLNTSVITANFSTQLVNMALDIQFPSKLFAVTTPAGIAIVGDTIWGMGTVACTGANCAAVGYNADLWARFSGTTASNVALAYHLIAGTPGVSTDLIQGAAAFSSATPPTPIVPQPFVQTDVSFEVSANNLFGYTGGGMTAAANVAPTAATPSFIWNYGCAACGSYAVTLPGATGAVNGNATSFATTGIQFGRWTNVPTVSLVSSTSYTIPFGGQFHWIKGPGLDPIYLPEVLLGNMSYTFDGGTAPTNQNGLTGTLSSAGTWLTVNFTNQTVDLALGLTGVNGHNWSASATGVPLSWTGYSKNGFWVNSGTTANSLNVTMDGVATATTGVSSYVSGQLTGSGLNGALFEYQLSAPSVMPAVPSTFTATDMVAVQAPSVTVTGPVTTGGPVSVAFPAGDPNATLAVQPATTLNMTLAAGVLNNVTLTGGITASVATMSADPTITGSYGGTAATGEWVAIDTYGFQYAARYSNFGEWRMRPTVGLAPATATGPFSSGAFAGGTLLTPVASMPVSNFAVSGNYTGTMVGAAQDSATNTPYSLNFGLVSLNANFATGTLSGTATGIQVQDRITGGAVGYFNDLSLTATIATNAFSGSVTANAASTAGTASPVNVTVGTVGASSGHFYGPQANELTGIWQLTSGTIKASGAFGAGNGTSNTAPLETVNGVVALVTATPANTATSYRLVGMSAYDPAASALYGGLRVDGGYNNATRVTEIAAGVTAFDAGFNANNVMANTVMTNTSSRFAIGTATQTELGFDSVTGISWGRWGGGMVDITDRATGVVTPSALGTSSLHWIATPSMTAPVALPTTGTYTYVRAGGTLPTDNLGNVGTLNNASLVANFTAQTVDVGVAVGFNNNTTVLSASGTGIPIQQRSFFNAQSSVLGMANQLTTSCTGAGCVTPTPGATINGAFTGATGAGAGMIYGFSNGSTVVNGVAAFHR